MNKRPEPLSGYKLIARIGGGGLGEVWKCEAPGGMLKAMKFVYGDVGSLGAEYGAEQELKSLERVRLVRHPFILSVERVDIVNSRLVIVTELADRTLWDRFRECRNEGLVGIPRDELIRYLQDVAEELDYMNAEHHIQHLDVKPTNLLLVQRHVKVADFGMVKMIEGSRAKMSGGVTPVYAAPETFERWASRFSDQYSLAIVYQELLTGVRPFTGKTAKQLLLQHMTIEPNLRSLPAKDRTAVRRALMKAPRDRFLTCLAFIEALKFAEGAVTPIPTNPATSRGATAPQSPPVKPVRSPATPRLGAGRVRR